MQRWDKAHKIVLANLGLRETENLHGLTPENVNVTSPLGSTPLHFGALSSNNILVSHILEMGATLEVVNVYGETPLHWACKGGSVEVLERLMQECTSLETADADGNTLVHWAAEYDNVAVLKLLVENGADIHAVNGDGDNALDIAAYWGNLEAVQFLLECGVSQDKAMLIAVKQNMEEVVDVLLAFLESQRKSKGKKRNRSLSAHPSHGKTGKLSKSPKSKLRSLKYTFTSSPARKKPNRTSVDIRASV